MGSLDNESQEKSSLAPGALVISSVENVLSDLRRPPSKLIKISKPILEPQISEGQQRFSKLTDARLGGEVSGSRESGLEPFVSSSIRGHLSQCQSSIPKSVVSHCKSL